MTIRKAQALAASEVTEEHMKAKLSLLVVAIASICTIWAARAQQSSTADVERYIRESERQWAESVANGDASVVERILADDFLGVDPDGSFYEKAKMVADTREAPKEFISNRLNDVNVRFFGDTAVAQGNEVLGTAHRHTSSAVVSSGLTLGSAAMASGKS